MNRRLALVTLILAFTLGACIPGISPIAAGDRNATAQALAGTLAVQTMLAQPTATLAPTDTPITPVPTSTATATQTIPPTVTFTPTGTATNTPDGTSTATASATLAATGSPQPGVTISTVASAGVSLAPSHTPTPGVLLWGTVPPEVPYARVHLVNKSNRMVYISFHCKLANGLTSYLEYPVYARLNVSIPAGPCHYVAWVKGEQFTGDLRFVKGLEYTFTFKNHKVIITQP